MKGVTYVEEPTEFYRRYQYLFLLIGEIILLYLQTQFITKYLHLDDLYLYAFQSQSCRFTFTLQRRECARDREQLIVVNEKPISLTDATITYQPMGKQLASF